MSEITDKPVGLKSSNDLDNLPLQTAAIEAAWVRFTGSSAGALDEAPELDDERTYIVKAKCAERKHKRNKDHEERLTAVMEIISVHEAGKVPRPQGDPNQTSLLTVVASPGVTGDDEGDSSTGDE